VFRDLQHVVMMVQTAKPSMWKETENEEHLKGQSKGKGLKKNLIRG